MRPGIGMIHTYTLGTGIEIFAFILTALASFLIYYKTRKIYSLTEHRGIKYFRKGFLYFGFSSIIMVFTFFLQPPFIDALIDRRIAFMTTSIFHLIGMSYLIASMHYKKISEYVIYLVNSVVIILSFYFLGPRIMGLFGLILLLTLGITSISKYHHTKKKKMFSQIYLIYISMFLFWIFLAFTQGITHLLKIGRFYGAIVTAIFFMYLAYLVMHELAPEKRSNKKNQEQ